MNRFVVAVLLLACLVFSLCGVPCFAQDEASAGASAALAFFSQPGCKKCRHVKALLDELIDRAGAKETVAWEVTHEQLEGRGIG